MSHHHRWQINLGERGNACEPYRGDVFFKLPVVDQSTIKTVYLLTKLTAYPVGLHGISVWWATYTVLYCQNKSCHYIYGIFYEKSYWLAVNLGGIYIQGHDDIMYSMQSRYILNCLLLWMYLKHFKFDFTCQLD